MKPTPPPHPQPATLDELLANAEHYARFCMANSGAVSPALFFIGADGHGMCVPESLKDISAKDDFADLCRQACLAHAATACVMVIEAWAKFAKPGEELDTTEAPSEALDRQEYVVLTGESRPDLKQRFLPIVRSDNGRFFGFGDPYEPGASLQGRFAQILPADPPDAASREVAHAMLQVRRASIRTTRRPRR